MADPRSAGGPQVREDWAFVCVHCCARGKEATPLLGKVKETTSCVHRETRELTVVLEGGCPVSLQAAAERRVGVR